eukprot:55140-Eustigmatos_ZCMA.PRE.1
MFRLLCICLNPRRSLRLQRLHARAGVYPYTLPVPSTMLPVHALLVVWSVSVRLRWQPLSSALLAPTLEAIRVTHHHPQTHNGCPVRQAAARSA